MSMLQQLLVGTGAGHAVCMQCLIHLVLRLCMRCQAASTVSGIEPCRAIELDIQAQCKAQCKAQCSY